MPTNQFCCPRKSFRANNARPLALNQPDEDDALQPKRPQGPSKLLEIGRRAKDKGWQKNDERLNGKDDDGHGDSFENYDDDEFESDDDKRDIKKALKYENRKAIKFQAQTNLAPPALNVTGNSDHSRPTSISESKPDFKQEGFAKSRGIVMNKRKINFEASNKQFERINALKKIIQIDFEEFHNQLNIKPQTAQGLYFDKLQTFKIKNEVVQSNDNYISKEMQTEDIQESDASMQFPEDLNERAGQKRLAGTQDLNGFMQRVTPVVEIVLEENLQLADLANPKAKDK